ncbi:MAG: CsgG/HfaB family protein [bacterium]
MRRLLTYVTVLTVVLATFGAASAVDTDVTNKATIVVGKITSKASHCSGGSADGIGDMLAASLAKTGQFILESDKSIKSAKPKTSDLMILGTVTEFETDAGAESGGWSGLKKKTLGKVGVDSKEAKLTIKLQLVDVASGKTLKEEKVSASSTDVKKGIGSGVEMSGLLKKYEKQPMGQAIHAVVAEMTDAVTKEVPKEYFKHVPAKAEASEK